MVTALTRNTTITRFKKIFTGDYENQKLQAATEQTINSLVDSEFINGNFFDMQINTTDTVLNHGLGRKYTGYTIIDRDANATIYTSSTENLIKERQVILKSSATVNARIYIF